MNHLINTPSIGGTTFKVDGITFNINHSYGHYTLRKVVSGKLSGKSELTNKSLEVIFAYLSEDVRISVDKVREAYDHVQTAA